MNADIMNHDENMNPIMETSDGERFSEKIDSLMVYLRQNKEMLGDMITCWLQMKPIDN